VANYRNKLYLINKIIRIEGGDGDDEDIKAELAELTIIELLKRIESLKTREMDSSLWTMVGGN